MSRYAHVCVCIYIYIYTVYIYIYNTYLLYIGDECYCITMFSWKLGEIVLVYSSGSKPPDMGSAGNDTSKESNKISLELLRDGGMTHSLMILDTCWISFGQHWFLQLSHFACQDENRERISMVWTSYIHMGEFEWPATTS